MLDNQPKTLRLLLSFFTFSLLCAVLVSCKDKDDPMVLDYHLDYFPVDSGHYVVYDVDSIRYTYNGNYMRDTIRFQWKQIIADTFYDNQNVLNYRLELYKRYNTTSGWSIDRVWFMKKDSSTAQKIEDDIRLIKLVFPPAEDKEWNGNVYVPNTLPYTDFKDWTYSYSDVHKPYTVNGFSFDSTVTVNEVNEENLIKKTLRKEVYAKGIGMVYQEWEILNKQNVQLGWETGAENGFKIRMRIAGHN